MNSAVALAGRARHGGDPGLEHIFADEFQVRMATAEESRKFLLQPGVDALESLLEARARLLIDPPHGLIERRQRLEKVTVLPIEVLLAFALFFELIDGRKIHLSELLHIL